MAQFVKNAISAMKPVTDVNGVVTPGQYLSSLSMSSRGLYSMLIYVGLDALPENAQRSLLLTGVGDVTGVKMKAILLLLLYFTYTLISIM